MEVIPFYKAAEVMSGRHMGSCAYYGVRYIRIRDVLPYSMLKKEAIVSPAGEWNRLSDGDILIPRSGSNPSLIFIGKKQVRRRLPVFFTGYGPHPLLLPNLSISRSGHQGSENIGPWDYRGGMSH